jgi:molybdopterin-guanine dinucleotide biosynthesis protein
LKIIVIAGKRSGVGKTKMAEMLLHHLDGWSAIKVTTVRQSKCPRNNSTCNVCNTLKGDYEIITNKKVINQEGTDTARLKQAGANRAIWLKANLKGLSSGIEKALLYLRDSEGVIIEGRSILKYIKPDLVIYLNGKNFKISIREKSSWIKNIIEILKYAK